MCEVRGEVVLVIITVSLLLTSHDPLCRDFSYDKTDGTCQVGDDGNDLNTKNINSKNKFSRDYGMVILNIVILEIYLCFRGLCL